MIESIIVECILAFKLINYLNVDIESISLELPSGVTIIIK